jgi:integrase
MASGVRLPEKALTAIFVRTVKEPGRYFDGHGLFLRVQPNGSKQWVQRITVRGKRREIGLGGASLVSLADARETALTNRRLARTGGDPLALKRKTAAILTFEEAARRAHEELSPTWKNPKDRAAFISTLKAYTFPRFGSVRVSDVTSADIRQALLDLRKKAPEVARKITYRIGFVFKWAIAEGMRSDNPAKGDALALPRFERKTSHRKALHYSQVAGCIAAVKASRAGPSTKLAFEFLTLTACRSGEVRGASWEEIDREGGPPVWMIPAERTKMRRLHKVPLAGRTLEILREAEKLGASSGLIFPSARGTELSDMTLSKLVKKLGFEADVHGFRTSFKTWSQEQTNFPPEVAEMALAHVIKNKAEAAYARSDLLEKRRKMMEAWDLFLEPIRKVMIHEQALVSLGV